MRRQRTARAAVAALVVALAACSVGSEETARQIDDDRVPFGLLDPPATTTSTTSTTVPDTTPGQQLRIFLVAGGRLRPVTRSVEALDPATALAALAAGPTEDEAELGISSPLATPESEPFVLGATTAAGVAVVDLAPSFATLDASTQLLAIGQLVLTMTRLPGVGQVDFTLAGAPVDVPRADGTLTADPVAADDYAALVAS